LPDLLPGFKPFCFKLRLKLSSEAEETRQGWLSLAPAKQTTGENEEALNEICDLLLEMPRGFGDIKDNGRGPGASFREYVEGTTDGDTLALLYSIVSGASGLYWSKTMPREFRKPVQAGSQ
jgi:hypothetical protein